MSRDAYAVTNNYVIDKATGTRIGWMVEKDIFPDEWTDESVNASAISLDKKEIKRSVQIVKQALSKYPVSLLKQNLKRVYILYDITFYGVSFGGTNSLDTIYLTNRGTFKGYTDLYIEQLFHEEFSSILLRNYPDKFDGNIWGKFNAQNFKYNDSTAGVAALKNKKDAEDFDDFYIKNGLLNQYAQSSQENDFNSFAKNIFKSKTNFWNIVDENKRIRIKTTIIINFYHSLDKMFTEEYFRNPGTHPIF